MKTSDVIAAIARFRTERGTSSHRINLTPHDLFELQEDICDSVPVKSTSVESWTGNARKAEVSVPDGCVMVFMGIPVFPASKTEVL